MVRAARSGQDQRRRPVAQAGALPAVTLPSAAKAGRSAASASATCPRAAPSSARHGVCPCDPGSRQGRSRHRSSRRAARPRRVDGSKRVGVLRLAGDAVLRRWPRPRCPCAALERTPEPVVDRRRRPARRRRGGCPGARAAADAGRAHALHAAGDDHVGFAEADRARAVDRACRPEAQTLFSVMAEARGRNARPQRRLAGRRLADTGLDDVAEQDIVDRCGGTPARTSAARTATAPSSARARRSAHPGTARWAFGLRRPRRRHSLLSCRSIGLPAFCQARPSPRAMTSLRISDVPSPMVRILASR